MANYASGYAGGAGGYGYAQAGGGGGAADGYPAGGAHGSAGGLSYSNAVEGFDTNEDSPKTIYVGNLDQQVTEDFITALFSQIGTVTKCKIIYEGGSEPYAFIEFTDHATASQALVAMNKRTLIGKEMKVNWATQPGSTQRVDTSKHYHIFIGDLSPEVDNKALKDAFTPFGEISDAKVIRDLQTLKSKGYGFVSYVNKEEAEKAIEAMNGQWLGRRTIRTNWATRKPQGPGGRQMGFDDVYNQTSPTNTSVYVGGITATTTEEDLRGHFGKYGTIMEIRIFKQQGYAFVRFESKEAATHAICQLNGSELNGQPVRCSWGRAGGGDASQAGAGGQNAYGYGYGYGGGGGAAGFGNTGANANANYWGQYYQQYYNNPALMQQWQNYWQQNQ